MDQCLRLPHCDKYIFDGKGNKNCKLLDTQAINVNLLKITGECAPENITVSNTHEKSRLPSPVFFWSAPGKRTLAAKYDIWSCAECSLSNASQSALSG